MNNADLNLFVQILLSYSSSWQCAPALLPSSSP